MQWLVKALIENKGQLGLHSLGITPLILAAMSKMTNSTPSNDSHSTKYAVFLQIPFTTLKQGYTSSSLQLILTWLFTLGSFKDHCRKYLEWELLLWSWQIHVWSTSTDSFCSMTGWYINWGLHTFGKQPYSISNIGSSTVLDIYQMMLQVTISGSCRSLRTNQYLKRFHLARWNSILGDYHLIIKCSKTPFPFLVLPLVRVPRILPLTISNQPLVEDRYLLLLLGE